MAYYAAGRGGGAYGGGGGGGAYGTGGYGGGAEDLTVALSLHGGDNLLRTPPLTAGQTYALVPTQWVRDLVNYGTRGYPYPVRTASLLRTARCAASRAHRRRGGGATPDSTSATHPAAATAVRQDRAAPHTG